MIRELPKDVGESCQEIGGKRSPDETMTSEEARAAAAAGAREKGETQPRPAVVRNLEASHIPTAGRPAALILASQILNRLFGYARKGSRTRKDYFRTDLNWMADVLLRVSANERNLLRPTGE